MIDSTSVNNITVSAWVGPYIGLGDIGGRLTVTTAQAPTQAQTIDTRIGRLDFEHGVPTQATVKTSMTRWISSALSLGIARRWLRTVASHTGRHHWRSPQRRSHLQGLPESPCLLHAERDPYTLGFLDLAKAGPVVMDVPVGPIAGSVMDFWQRPLSDLGLAGPDQGKGGNTYLSGRGRKHQPFREALYCGRRRFASSTFTEHSTPIRPKPRRCRGV